MQLSPQTMYYVPSLGPNIPVNNFFSNANESINFFGATDQVSHPR
jgi:hypothetical protein